MFLYAIAVRAGSPTRDELQSLARKLGDEWKRVGRSLHFEDSELTGIVKDNDEFFEQKYAMLRKWKERDGSTATYIVLYEALCNENVNRRDLAQEFCYNN